MKAFSVGWFICFVLYLLLFLSFNLCTHKKSFNLMKFPQPFPVPPNDTKPLLLREHKTKDVAQHFLHSFPEQV